MNPTILLVCLQLNLSGNQIGAYFNGSEWVNTPEGPKAIADALGVNASLTVVDLRYNELDSKSAMTLATTAKEKGMSLCGITPGQTEADFRPSKNDYKSMKPADAILLTADIFVRASLTSVRTLAHKPSRCLPPFLPFFADDCHAVPYS